MLQVCLDQLAKTYYSYVYVCNTYDIEVHKSCKYDFIQNTFGVKKVRPSKVESYLEVNT